MEDWVQHVPPEGVREMCSWERFCAFAREPETRKVAVDARVSVAGVRYAVDPDLAGETVTLWFGLYDDQLYVEHGDNHIPSDLVVGGITAHRKPPEVRIWRFRNRSCVGTFPPLTSTPHWPACWARR
jgi:hypothetical protein